jgi:hypothetical protein
MNAHRILLRLTQQVFGASGSIEGGEDHGFNVSAQFVLRAETRPASSFMSLGHLSQ